MPAGDGVDGSSESVENTSGSRVARIEISGGGDDDVNVEVPKGASVKVDYSEV